MAKPVAKPIKPVTKVPSKEPKPRRTGFWGAGSAPGQRIPHRPVRTRTLTI